MELFQAHREWANRPADERFASVADLRDNALADKAASREIEVDADKIGVAVKDDRIFLKTADGRGAPMTEWAFSQACRLAGAPPAYLEGLSANTAACALSESLKATRSERADGTVRLLARHGHIAAINGPRYGRIFDADVLDHVIDLPGNWSCPPAHAMNGSAAAGLYRGQRDMFVFRVDETHKVDSGKGRYLSRGYFAWNSEVGARSFGLCAFLYDHVCGNHIVWGATDVIESRLRHIGEKVWDRARAEIEVVLRAWVEETAAKTEQQIKIARTTILGETKEEVVAQVVKVVPQASQKLVSNAWEGASQWAEVDDRPNTAWGMAQAITRYAQMSQWANDRVETDRVAGQLLRVTLARAA